MFHLLLNFIILIDIYLTFKTTFQVKKFYLHVYITLVKYFEFGSMGMHFSSFHLLFNWIILITISLTFMPVF